jgi:hypothetical protein
LGISPDFCSPHLGRKCYFVLTDRRFIFITAKTHARHIIGVLKCLLFIFLAHLLGKTVKISWWRHNNSRLGSNEMCDFLFDCYIRVTFDPRTCCLILFNSLQKLIF